MAVRVFQVGSSREQGEGTRLGVVRRPPRGVKKEDYAARDFYDAWFPELAPSAKLVKWYYEEPMTDTRWARYVKMYRREMGTPDRRRIIDVLARLSRQADFAVGCYCEREDRCHRSILRDLLAEHGAEVAAAP
jgi:uncharacterized protein YeaO (DUF488 family)